MKLLALVGVVGLSAVACAESRGGGPHPDAGVAGTSSAGITARGGGNSDCEGPACDAQHVVCDGSDRIRIGFNVAGGQVDDIYAYTNPYGHQFFAIDGRCRFLASRDEGEGLVEGELSDAEADRLASELHFSRLSRVSGVYGLDCPDASGVSLRTPSAAVTCVCTCDGAPPAASDAVERAGRWLEALVERGHELDGAIRVLAEARERSHQHHPTHDWPLGASIESTEDLVFERGTTAERDAGARFAGMDAAALRDLRATAWSAAEKAQEEGRWIESPIVRDSASKFDFRLYLQDELPTEDAAALDDFFATSLR